MDLFNTVVNVIESFLFAFYIFKVREYKYDFRYIFIAFVIFIEEMISNYYDPQNFYIIIIIPTTLFIYQCIREKEVNPSYMFTAMTATIITCVGNITSISILINIIRINPSLNIHLVIILSKTLCFPIMYIVAINMRDRVVTTMDTIYFSGLTLLLINTFDFDTRAMIANEITQTVNRRMLTFVGVTFLLYQFFISYSNNITEAIKLTIEKVNAERLKRQHAKIIDLEHNLKYTLLNIVMSANDNDIGTVQDLANGYLGRVVKNSNIVVTSNSYFDYKINEIKIRYKRNGISIKNRVSLLDPSKMSEKIVDEIMKAITLTMTIDVEINNQDFTCIIEESEQACVLKIITKNNNLLVNEMRTIEVFNKIDIHEKECKTIAYKVILLN
ncbi:MAG: hypothetical protein ACK5LC_06930 [Coprobacillaceae bacterium]